jgi:hypothetical protein
MPFPHQVAQTSDPSPPNTVPSYPSESEHSYPQDRKVKEMQIDLERQIAAGQEQLNELQHGSSTVSSSSSSLRVADNVTDEETLALRQLVEEMRREMDRLRLREQRESRLTLALMEEPPPEYQATSHARESLVCFVGLRTAIGIISSLEWPSCSQDW